jgi:O-antigen/teichoic acid export membrane protein
MTSATEVRPPVRTVRFLQNVLWSWLGVTVAIFAGLVLAPFFIRRLGEEGYGIWALVFALLDYYDVLDFGFRSAVVKYTAHYRATNEPDQVSAVINTALVYFSAIGALVMLGTLLVFRSLHLLFQIPPAYQPQFAKLILLVGFSWSAGAVCHSFGASLEGFQRFDLYNRVWIIYNTVRAFGCGALLWLGYGLVPLGIMVVSSQLLLYALNFRNFRQVLPAHRFDPRAARFSMFLQLLRYGRHTFVANTAGQVVAQGPSVLIGHFLPTAFVGYYAIPNRLIQVAITALDSVTSVSSSNSAELLVKGETQTIARMGVLVNRYCLSVFLPIATILWLYRNNVIETWIRNPVYVTQSAPLVPILLLGALFVLVGQVNTASILYGLGRHNGYARGLLVEGCLSVVALAYVIPRYGILAAAAVAVALMILDRGVYLPWYLSRVLEFPFRSYMAGIYTRPLLISVPVVAVAYGLKVTVFPGSHLLEIAAASFVTGCFAWGLGFFTALEEEHRTMLLELLQSRLEPLLAWFGRQPA